MAKPSVDYLRDILPRVCDISIVAGKAIMEIYRDNSFDVEYKSDKSPVTCADLKADEIITEGLQLLASDIPILSEESNTQIPYTQRSQWETYWLVDPLDGTKGFIAHNGYFTVNIALIHNHTPILGVIYAPNTETLYYAAKQCGVFKKNKDSSPVAIKIHSAFRKEPIVVASRAHINKPTKDLIKSIKGAKTVNVDSSLKCCLVAEGSADLYLRVGPTCEWDTAASQSIVEEAGGFLTDTSGQPLEYNRKDSLINPPFIVYTEFSPKWRNFMEDIKRQ